MNQMFKEVENLNLPIGHYIISGSGPLGIRKIREIADIDLVVDETLWETLSIQYGVIEEKGIEKIVIPETRIEIFGPCSFEFSEVEKRIANAEIIKGLPFESLDYVIQYKKSMGRDKDLKDLKLIEDWKSKPH